MNKPASADTGLTSLGDRFYDATLGRFTSADPVLATGNPQQVNGYSYGANDPITNTDPSGDCYEAASDSLTHSANCARGHSVTARSASTVSYAHAKAVGVGNKWVARQTTNPARGSVAKARESGSDILDGYAEAQQRMAATSERNSVVGLGIAIQVAFLLPELACADSFAAEWCQVEDEELLEGLNEADASADAAIDESLVASRPATSGETSATKLGREAHRDWDYGQGFEREFTLPSGKRADAVNFDTREILELKPDNPRAIRLGLRQVGGSGRHGSKGVVGCRVQ